MTMGFLTSNDAAPQGGASALPACPQSRVRTTPAGNRGNNAGCAAAAIAALTPIERRAFDYTALEEAMANLDAVARQTRHNLSTLRTGGPVSATDVAAAVKAAPRP